MKTKLATFQSPVQAFRDYRNSLPWYSFIEKFRLKSLIDESVVLEEIDASMERLNDVEILSLDSYLKSIIVKKKALLYRLAAIINRQNKDYEMRLNDRDQFDTKFTILPKNRPAGDAATIYDDDSQQPQLSALIRQIGLKDFKEVTQLVFTIDQINNTLQKGISKQNRERVRELGISISRNQPGTTNGLIDENTRKDADTIAFERQDISSNKEVKQVDKYHYLYANDHWTIEDSAILFRILAHAIRNATIIIPFEECFSEEQIVKDNNENYIVLNEQKYLVETENNRRVVRFPLSIDLATKAAQHRGLSKEEILQRYHYNAIKKILSQLNFRFVDNPQNPKGPRKIELHSGITRDKANVAGLSYIDITDFVVRNGKVPSDLFNQNNADATKLAKIKDIRDEIFSIQNMYDSPGYGRDTAGHVFPLNNGSALENYIRIGVSRRLPGIDLAPYVSNINFNQNLEILVTEAASIAEAAKPGFWNWLSRDAEANRIKHAVLNAIATELKAVKDYRDRLNQKEQSQSDDLNLNTDFQKDLQAAEQLFTIKHEYNRFSHVDNKQLLGLAYESEKQINRFDKFAEELKSYKPSNFFTRWWRSDALKLAEEKEQALKKAKDELAKYREGLAEEMFVRINKYVLTPEMLKKDDDQYDLFEEYKAFIEMYGSIDTKSKLVMRTNYRAHLTTLLSKGLNDDNRAAITKYIDVLIGGTKEIEKESLIILKKILLGEAFDVNKELTDMHVKFIMDYFNPEKNDPKKMLNLNDPVKQAQAEQLHQACVAFELHLRQGQHRTRDGGYNNSSLFPYFAKEFGGSNLQNIFNNANKNKALISTELEKAKVRTYTQLIDKFCRDAQHASEVLNQNRDLAEANLKYFESLLIKGKHYPANLRIGYDDRFAQDDIRVKYIPIAVLPHQTIPEVRYGYETQLTNFKKSYLGDTDIINITRDNFDTYNAINKTSIYQGEHFALDHVMAVIGKPTEKGRYIEMRLAAIFCNPAMFVTFNNQYMLTSKISFTREIDFVNEFRNEVQSNVDNALRYLYYKYGWNPKTQEIVDKLASTALKEEVRLDRLEHLLKLAGIHGNDYTNGDEQDFLKHLKVYKVNSDNFATSARLDRFNKMIEKYLGQTHKPNALLEEVIFNFTKSNQYRDGFVLKELSYNIKENDQARSHFFHDKWSNRLETQNSIYTAHLPKSYDEINAQENAVNSESFISSPIVTKENQSNFDKIILDTLFSNGVSVVNNRYVDYKGPYNPNNYLLAEFASCSVQREVNLQLMSNHLADPNDKKSSWRYLPIAPIDNLSAADYKQASAEQKNRNSMFVALEITANKIYEVVNTRKNEVGFGSESVSKTQFTNVHKEEYLLYQGFTRHFDDTKATLLALYGPRTVKRMRESYGLVNIENLTNCVGQKRLLQLATILDRAITRIENAFSQDQTVPHAKQTTWAAAFIISDAFMAEISRQLDEQRVDINKISGDVVKVDALSHNRLKDLMTRFNKIRLQVESAGNADVSKKQAVELIEHHQITRLFNEVILNSIGEINGRAGLLADTSNDEVRIKLMTEINANHKLLKEVFGLLVGYAKTFRHDKDFAKLYNELRTEFKQAATQKPLLLASSHDIVKAEMRKVDELWQAVEKEIFDDELSLQKTAEGVRVFKVLITDILSNPKNIGQSSFRASLMDVITKNNLMLLRFFDETEIGELQKAIETIMPKLNAFEDKIFIQAFLNIVKTRQGFVQEADLKAVEQYSLFNEIAKFAFEPSKKFDFTGLSVAKLTALKDGPYGKLDTWNLLVKLTIDRYLSNPSLDLNMLSICDVFGNDDQKLQASAVRFARRFISKVANAKGFELRSDFDRSDLIGTAFKESGLNSMRIQAYTDLQNAVTQQMKEYDPNFRNVIFCKNQLEIILDVKNSRNKFANSTDSNKHIEFVATIFVHVQLQPLADHNAINNALRIFIDKSIELLNRRPVQTIPCGTDFIVGIVRKLAISSDIQKIEEAVNHYNKIADDSVKAAKKLALDLNQAFNDIAYFRGKRGTTHAAIQKMLEGFSKYIEKLSTTDDNHAAREMFITTFNNAQPNRIKLAPHIVPANSTLNDAKAAINDLFMKEIQSLKVIEEPASPNAIAANVKRSPGGAPGLSIKQDD